MNTADKNDQARRKSEETALRQERRDNFFRCGGYDHMPSMTPKQQAAARTKLEDHADLLASREYGDEKDAEIL
jgi:hypothetical protein